MKALVVVLILAGGGYLFYQYIMPTNQDWIHGRWEYYDESGKEVDFMVFRPNGTVDLEDDKGKYFTCVYVTWGETLNVECEVKGEKREMVFDVSADQRTLSNLEHDSIYNKISD